MGVTGSTHHLFCEGEPNSYDIQILSRIVSGSGFLVIPAGGKFGMRSFMEGYRARSAPGGRRLLFRDRDLDAEPPSAVGLIELKDRPDTYLTHRSCIENYLLEPEQIHRCWTEMAKGPEWKHGPAWALARIERCVEEAARDIADYQAVRWALAKLKPGEPGTPWPAVRSTWMMHSGNLPTNLDMDFCRARAQELVATYVHDTSDVAVPALARWVEHFRRCFGQPEFWQTRRYMIWFHGKDLKKAMNRRGIRINLDSCCEWVAQNMEWRHHPDLLQLHGML